ncbi:hypothetical protein YB2330_002848 [Saitoella coloradoensis]
MLPPRTVPAWTIAPPSPESLGAPKKPSKISRKRTTLMILGLAGAGAYFADGYFNGRAIRRTLRTAWTGVVIAVDYKINFNEGNAAEGGIDRLHERVAKRMYDTIRSNGGLYIKIGQALAMQADILPPAYSRMFSTLFDSAPAIPWREVHKILTRELGRPPEEVFAYIDPRVAASASIAQVHRARLHTGEWVAVKVQKPEIAKQVEWDLWSYKMLLYVYENYIFDIPIYFTADFTAAQLRSETDFVNEAKNAEKTAAFIATEPSLRGRVRVPEVFWDYTTSKIMTATWEEGVRINENDNIRRMGISHKEVMQTMCDLFAAQMFKFGFLHADPHPGNILVRRKAKGRGSELVLLDHGLYISEPETLREDYCELWKSLVTFDNATIRKIAVGWGITNPDLLASATLLRPYSGGKRGSLGGGKNGKQGKVLDPYEAQLALKKKLKSFLSDTSKIPQELLFIGRNMRIVQANNRQLGSPVNRITILANWASRSLADLPRGASFSARICAWWKHIKFRFAITVINGTFYWTRVKQIVTGSKDSYEDLILKEMRSVARGVGLDVSDKAFEG